MTRTTSFLLYLLLVPWVACGPPPAPSPPVRVDAQTSSAPAEAPIDLRFAGSSTIGEQLVPKLLEAFIGKRGGRALQWIDDGTDGTRRLVVGEGDAVPRHVSITTYGSGTAFQALREGKADIGMSSRVISASELFTLSSLGDFKNAQSEHIIALDGVAVIVSSTNAIISLTIEQIAGIFACRITDWSQVGGRLGPINIYSRDQGSGTRDTFESLVLARRSLSLCTAARRVTSSLNLSRAVAADPNGIGFVGLPYVLDAHALRIVECDRGFSIPSAFTIRSREYLLARGLYFYTPPRPSSPFVQDFIEFALSPEGQEIADREGFVSLAIRPEASDPQDRRLAEAMLSTGDASVLSDLVAITRGASRLAVTFQFESGSLLDELGRDDINRLALFLRAPAVRRREVMLLGFTDDRGDYRNNLRLSHRRAEAVADALREQGAIVDVVRGFGEEAPVACNTDESGKARNRHVEVWLR